MIKESSVKKASLTTCQERVDFFFPKNFFTVTFKHLFAWNTRLNTIIYQAVNKETLSEVQTFCYLGI